MAYCVITVENTDGIDDVTDDPSDDAPVFDASGREIKKVKKGLLYIKRGKKYIAQ